MKNAMTKDKSVGSRIVCPVDDDEDVLNHVSNQTTVDVPKLALDLKETENAGKEQERGNSILVSEGADRSTPLIAPSAESGVSITQTETSSIADNSFVGREDDGVDDDSRLLIQRGKYRASDYESSNVHENNSGKITSTFSNSSTDRVKFDGSLDVVERRRKEEKKTIDTEGSRLQAVEKSREVQQTLLELRDGMREFEVSFCI
jgi:hypothetical protein